MPYPEAIKTHSNLSTCLALRWPSLTARILVSKLSFLSKLSGREDSIGSHIFSSLLQDSLRLVHECLYLEGKFSCQGCTDALLSSQLSLRDKKSCKQTGMLVVLRLGITAVLLL